MLQKSIPARWMENQKLDEYYSEHSSTIFSEMLGEDENYRRLKKAKIAAEKALRDAISKEAWKLSSFPNRPAFPDL